jgi:hypothetical protein
MGEQRFKLFYLNYYSQFLMLEKVYFYKIAYYLVNYYEKNMKKQYENSCLGIEFRKISWNALHLDKGSQTSLSWVSCDLRSFQS